MDGPRENEIPPSSFGVSCFLRDGLLQCKRKLIPEREAKGGLGQDPRRRGPTQRGSKDPQRDALSSREPDGFQRDAEMQRALEARGSVGQLDYPELRAGSLLQGSVRPHSDFGREWREPPVGTSTRSHARGAASFETGRSAPTADVPRVSSLMYSQ